MEFVPKELDRKRRNRTWWNGAVLGFKQFQLEAGVIENVCEEVRILSNVQ